MPSNRDPFITSTAFLVLSCSATSALLSYWLTKRSEENKALQEKKEAYERELMIKSKTLEARKLKGEPSGNVIEDVTLDRIFLYEVEDLKSRFPSSILVRDGTHR